MVFEVPTSLNVPEHEQMLPLPALVAGAPTHLGKTKPSGRGSPDVKCRRSKDSTNCASAGGSASQLRWEADSERTGPALHHQGLHVS